MMREKEIKSALKKVYEQRLNWGFIERFTVDENEVVAEALEKQIPKKPIPQDEDCLECPNCDSFIGYASECREEHYRVEYCPICGQAIDWSD